MARPHPSQRYQEILREAGRGNPFLVTDDFELGTASSCPTATPAACTPPSLAGQQLSRTSWSKAIVDDRGRWPKARTNWPETHADTKEARVANTERCLAESEQRWWKEVLRLACANSPDGEILGVNPRGLAAVLSTLHRRRIEPAEIIELWPPLLAHPARDDAEARMNLYDRAVNKLGLRIMEDQPYQDFGFRRPRSEKRRLRARTQVVGDTDRLSTNVGSGAANADSAQGSGAAPPAGAATDGAGASLELTSTDLGAIVGVSEGRGAKGLGPASSADGSPDPDGELTIIVQNQAQRSPE